ncbi:DUF4123 domain-containing protein [Thioalkalivibrio sp. ALR17-21]|uniref:DUF4123 domain-containing protein n=1 Tax=Thioalkalivibrio sp. ALR17-21 TaxID=1269813 RepID=UPI00040B1237|nr:DUF4123 domain-containing protein [Thioalkalivibrio sp. ALR17-21]
MSERVQAPGLSGVWAAQKEHAAWLVLDQAPSTLRRVYELDDAPEVEWLFRETRYAALEDRSPLLVRTRPDTPLWQAFAEARGEPPMAGILLRTTTSPDDLVAHLRHRLEAAIGPNRRALLRFQDPWVASALFADESGAAQWLGPIDGVFWFGGTFAERAANGPIWHGLTRTPDEAGEPAGADAPPVPLTPEQRTALQTLAEQQALWRETGQHVPLDASEPADAGAFLRALDEAGRLAIPENQRVHHLVRQLARPAAPPPEPHPPA